MSELPEGPTRQGVPTRSRLAAAAAAVVTAGMVAVVVALSSGGGAGPSIGTPEPAAPPQATATASPDQPVDGGSVATDPGGSVVSSGEQLHAPECPDVAPQHLAAGLGEVSVAHVCSVEVRVVPGDGTWAIGVVRRVTGGLPALLGAYAKPDDTPQSGVACAAIGYLPLVVWLEAGGTTLPVKEPRVGPCLSPDEAAVTAYRSLTFTTVREMRLRQVTSQVSVTSGCPQQVKDMIDAAAQDAPPRSGSGLPKPLVDASTAQVVACVYDRVGDASSPEIATTLVTGRALTSAELGEVNAGLAASAPLGDCDVRAHRRTVVLLATAWTQIALDGCAVVQDTGLWRGSDRLRTALRSL